MAGCHQETATEKMFFRQKIDQRIGVLMGNGMIVIMRMPVMMVMRVGRCVNMRLGFDVKRVVSGFASHEHAQAGQQHGQPSGEQGPDGTALSVSPDGNHCARIEWQPHCELNAN